MSFTKTRRAAVPSAVDTPVTAHTLGSTSLSKEQVERVLTEFIDSQEARLDQNLTNINTDNASLSQLKRIQRDLRGLPPLEPVFQTKTAPAVPASSTAKSPKKIVFSDLEKEEGEEDSSNTGTEKVGESAVTETASEIVKDDSDERTEKKEKKRSKKEHKKSEKRRKTESSSS